MYNKKVIRFTLGYSSLSVIGLKINLNKAPTLFLLSNQCFDRIGVVKKCLGGGETDNVNLVWYLMAVCRDVGQWSGWM